MNLEEAMLIMNLGRGFLSENLEQKYQSLLAFYNPSQCLYGTEEYYSRLEIIDKIKYAYFILKLIPSCYIMSTNNRTVVTGEEMVNKILRLVCDSVKRNKPIDSNIIANLVEIIVCSRGLNEYVKHIDFYEKGRDSKNESAYVSDYRILKLYLERITAIPFYWQELNSTEKLYAIFHRAIYIICHEIEHVNQKRTKLTKNNIETIILKDTNSWRKKYIVNPDDLSLVDYIKRLINIEKGKYYKYWQYNPCERMAEIYAHTIGMELASQLECQVGTSFEHLYNQSKKGLIYTIYFGYDKKVCPTEFYYNKWHLKKQYELIAEQVKNLPLEERLRLGLSITKEEYIQIINNQNETILKMYKKNLILNR